MKIAKGPLCLFVLAWPTAGGFSFRATPKSRCPTTKSRRASPSDRGAPSEAEAEAEAATTADRRTILRDSLAALGIAPILLSSSAPRPALAEAVRAVGSAELDCRREGNCLEKFEIDGAVGWTWGGRDRCDASDPLCGPDGKLREEAPSGEAIPEIPEGSAVTDVVEVELQIGRQESVTMRMGLYGDACPSNVRRMLEFCSPELKGIDTISKKLLTEDNFYAFSVPVSMTRGGSLNVVYPGQRLDFGVPSQMNAYARSKGLSRAEGFTPQPRPPTGDGAGDELSARKHDAAGFVSVPRGGIGYGGTGFEGDDEAFGSAFQITAGNVPAMDREGRRVIGQLMDGESMEALARLSSLATRKGFKGVIPGQNAGPPLLKVTVNEIVAKTVSRSAEREGSS